MSYQKRTKDQLAARVAQDIFDGAVVNLGIGQPTLVANHLPEGREVILHSENGILGMGPAPAEGEEDYDVAHTLADCACEHWFDRWITLAVVGTLRTDPTLVLDWMLLRSCGKSRSPRYQERHPVAPGQTPEPGIY